MAKLIFLKGTQAQYDAMQTKDVNTFYFIDETNLYLGEIKLSNAADLAAAIEDIAANAADIEQLQKDLATLVGGGEGTSIQDMIDTAIAEATQNLQDQITTNKEDIDDLKVDAINHDGRIEDLEEKMTVLNGDAATEGSVAKEVQDAINAFAQNATDNGTIDTFKELVDYVAEHGGDAAEMASAIETLETKVGEKSVAAQIQEAIAGENLAQYATKEALEATNTNVGENAEAIANLQGLVGDQKVADLIATAKSEANTYADEAAASALADAKAYADNIQFELNWQEI